MKLVEYKGTRSKHRTFEVGAHYIEFDCVDVYDHNIYVCRFIGSDTMEVLYETNVMIKRDGSSSPLREIDHTDHKRGDPLQWRTGLICDSIYKLNDDEVLKYVVMSAL